MNSYLLFRKKTAMDEDGLPWLKGGDEFKSRSTPPAGTILVGFESAT